MITDTSRCGSPSTRRKRALTIIALVLALSAVLPALMASAQIPDRFTNLKVLPKDISKDDLLTTMRSYASALGVHCGYCHAAAEGNPRELDFASDAKPEKETARGMIRMAGWINSEQLPKITTLRSDHAEVECRTCHHGLARPRLIENVLSASYQAGGLDSLEARYETLRKEYYGTDSYDFGESVLPELAGRILGRDNPGEMVKLAEYNLRWFPGSGRAYLMLGQAHAAAGDKETAIRELKKSIELDPELQRAAGRQIEALQSGSDQEH